MGRFLDRVTSFFLFFLWGQKETRSFLCGHWSLEELLKAFLDFFPGEGFIRGHYFDRTSGARLTTELNCSALKSGHYTFRPCGWVLSEMAILQFVDSEVCDVEQTHSVSDD